MDKQIKLARRGKITRRDFVQYALAAGVSLAAAQHLFITAARAEPKRGGKFRIALGSGATTDSLDPATFPDTFNGIFGWGSLRGSLTELGADGQIAGDVAESFEASADAKTWIFKIRKGVEFHNGKAVEAADVVSSINHHRGEESKSAAKSLLESLSDVKADGKDTVIFTLNA